MEKVKAKKKKQVALPKGTAERMECVVEGTHREAARAERKIQFRRRQKEAEGPRAIEAKVRVLRHYDTSRRLRRVAAAHRIHRSG
ncbi:MAG: hypothetical protein JKY65_28335 [Planctomycetes bacterium]|nr:hypothetical protein [Planctomycetota bacterium]